MNRLYYYLILIIMLTNIVTSIPRILLNESNNGAITSIFIAIVVGMILIYLVTTFFNGFPGMGLPELMKDYTPKWFSYPVLVFFIVTWYISGLITLITFSFILRLFLTPEMPIILVVFSFVLVILFGILMKTENVLFSTEIVLIIFLPFIIFMFIKAYGSPELNWDYVRVAMMHVKEMPNYSVFAASMFIFHGVNNLLIFNRIFTKKQNFGFKQLLFIGILGVSVLFTTYFIPIGFSGFDQIERLIYPWISTSDSIRMKFGLIERIFFIFLLSFLGVALMSIIIQWHVTKEILGSIISLNHFKWKEKYWAPHLVVFIFGAIGIITTMYITEHQLFQLSKLYFNLLPIFVLVFLFSMLLVKRGAKS